MLKGGFLVELKVEGVMGDEGNWEALSEEVIQANQGCIFCLIVRNWLKATEGEVEWLKDYFLLSNLFHKCNDVCTTCNLDDKGSYLGFVFNWIFCNKLVTPI